MTTFCKKILALVIAMALLATCLVIPGVVSAASEEEIRVWNGETTAPSDSDNDGVYEINTPEELAYVVTKNEGKSYILTTDIYLNELDKVDWTTGVPVEGYTPNEWFEITTFTGNFDGQGHVVYGIWYPVGNNAEVDYNRAVGLFPKIGANTTVKNVGVKTSYLETKGFAGAIVGFMTDLIPANSTIDNCFSDETVTLKGYQPVANNYQFGAGGIIGGFYNNSYVTISNCYSSANTFAYTVSNKTENRNCKIVGDIWLAGSSWETTYTNLVMKNCYAYGEKPCPGGKNATFTKFENVYSNVAPASLGPWTQVSLDNMKGAKAASMNLGETFYLTSGTPALKVFNKNFSKNAWSGFRDGNLEGEGTAESPYLVYTAEQLAYAVNTTENKVYQLQNDIVLNDIVVKLRDGAPVIYNADGETLADKADLMTWSSGAFPGTIDGNGYVVHGMYFEGTPATDNSGASAWENNFAFIKKAAKTTVIENLGIEDSYVVATNGTAAGFVGYLQASSAIVRNSYLGDSVYLEGQCVGGIFGSGDMSKFGPGAIENCYVTATFNCHGTRWGAFYAETWSRSATMTITNVYSTMRLADGNLPAGTSTCYGDVKAESGAIGAITDGNQLFLGEAFRAVEGGLPVLRVFDKDTKDMAWGGLGTVHFAGGDGSEEAPYLVSTPEQLAYMVYSGGNGKNFKLVNDIVVTNLDDVNWATGELKEGIGYTPVNWFEGKGNSGDVYGNMNASTSYSRFSGKVDGNGYAVSGLYYEPYYEGRDIEKDGKWGTCVGLIPSVTGTTISNLILTDSYIAGGRFTGGVVGHATNSTINNVVVTNSVLVKTVPVGKANGAEKEFESYSAGGILGYAHGTFNMDGCGSSAIVECKSHCNGLIGTRWNTKITVSNSYSVGVRPLAKDGSTNGSDNASNVYTDATTTGAPEGVIVIATEEITGKNALANMNGFDTEFWYGVEGQGPLFRAYGERIADINCDGRFEKTSDAEALRVGIITGTETLFSDINTDTVVNILDLVAIAK